MQDARVKAYGVGLVLCVCACSEEPSQERCESLVIRPAEFVLEDMPLRLLDSGADVTLIHPTQGGRVILIGAQVENLTTDTVDIETTLRDPQSRVVYTEAARTIAMTPVAGEPTLMQPD